MIHGQLNLSDVMAREADLYREALAQNILRNDNFLIRYFEKIVAEMPPPPDPFWKEWQL